MARERGCSVLGRGFGVIAWVAGLRVVVQIQRRKQMSPPAQTNKNHEWQTWS